jgi:UDP-N-acetylmuramoyl-L-alanyl-D-glutamate--2,6-diaminopimelate ligase
MEQQSKVRNSKPWNAIAAGITTLGRGGDAEPEITGLEYDSRRVAPGCIFVAMRGGSTDGNRYLANAIQAGAAAIITDSHEAFATLAASAPHLPRILVAHGRTALAEASAAFFDHPERRIHATGITGTNGKTTTAFLIESLLRAAARKTVMIGTIEYRIADETIPSPHTTPESRDLFAYLAMGVERGATELVTEVSSHALDQGRIASIPFDVAVFTNLTQDHLDYHGTMEAYLAAKTLLFDGTCYPAPRVAVLNADDPSSDSIARAAKLAGAEPVFFGVGIAEWSADEISFRPQGTRFHLHSPFGAAHVESPLLGEVNVLNLLAAFAATSARGVPWNTLIESIPHLHPVPGRFEPVHCGQPFTVLVDYAHTDDALRNLLPIARRAVSGGRVLTLFGCGGDRDRTKRPRMGRAAGEGSDLVILTSDNPRSEEPEAILREVLPGLESTGTPFLVEPDRARAIALAIGQAQPGDVVVLAGKGHEKVQILRDGVIPFDDVEIARLALRSLGWSCPS